MKSKPGHIFVKDLLRSEELQKLLDSTSDPGERLRLAKEISKIRHRNRRQL